MSGPRTAGKPGAFLATLPTAPPQTSPLSQRVSGAGQGPSDSACPIVQNLMPHSPPGNKYQLGLSLEMLRVSPACALPEMGEVPLRVCEIKQACLMARSNRLSNCELRTSLL